MIIILMLTLISPVTSQSEAPNEGTWTIDRSMDENNKIIEMNGDIIIEDGGDLTLNNVDLRMNCNSDREFKIKIENGGELTLRNSKIRSTSGDNFALIVESEGELNIYNSNVTDFSTHELFPVEKETFQMVALLAIIVVIVIIIVLLAFLMMKPRSDVVTTTPEKLVGESGVVTKRINPNNFDGKVKVESEVWSAKGDKVLQPGQKIKVVDHKGINLIVEKEK